MKSTSKIKKYILIYMKRYIFLWLFCATLCAVPIFIVSLQYDILPYDMFICLVPYGFAGILILINGILLTRFTDSITKQEKLYSISFSDDEATRIDDVVYLSREWLVCIGKFALYKKHISKMYFHEENNPKNGISYNIVLQTLDDQNRYFYVGNKNAVEKIERWLENEML